jgi:hypothetical protein
MRVEKTSTTTKPARVLLVKSCSNDPAYNVVNHPLGLMSIAAYLREKCGYQVKIEDLRLSGNGRSGLESEIRLYAPDIVGISALTFESDAIPWIADCVKRVNANTPVLLGEGNVPNSLIPESERIREDAVFPIAPRCLGTLVGQEIVMEVWTRAPE